MLKDVALVCSARQDKINGLGLAKGLARQFDARLSAECLIPDMFGQVAVGVGASGMAAIPPNTAVIQDEQRQLEERASRLHDQFSAECDELPAGSEWRVATDPDLGARAAVFIRERDIAIVDAVVSDTDGWHSVVERIILESGRPVIVVPETWQDVSVPQIVQINWDGSGEAARSVHDAMPLLKIADQVCVVTAIDDKDESREDRAGRAQLVRHLRRHGVRIKTQAVSRNGRSAADALAKFAEETGAQLIVMGAYGGTWLRETVFGSKTDQVLEHCDIPVLLSH